MIEYVRIELQPRVHNDQRYRELDISVQINGERTFKRLMLYGGDLDSWLDLYFEEAKKELKAALKLNEKPMKKIVEIKEIKGEL